MHYSFIYDCFIINNKITVSIQANTILWKDISQDKKEVTIVSPIQTCLSITITFYYVSKQKKHFHRIPYRIGLFFR